MDSNNTQTSIIITDKYRRAAQQLFPHDNYKGLAINARTGLHEYVAQLIINNFPPGATLLDLGSGSGTMSLRLLDLGFQVTAADIVAESFLLYDKIQFKCLDLNTSFSKEFKARFDGIIAIELIEHLENPRNFLRECTRLLSHNGKILLTTPNVDNPVSKALFLREGSFLWFNDYNYQTEGHITPITQWQIDKFISECKLNIVSLTSFGNPYENVKKSRKKIYVLAKMIEQIYAKDRALMGEILVIVATLLDFV